MNSIPSEERKIWSYTEFMTVWAGQFISVFGSQVTAFALSIWIFHESGSVIEFGLVIAAQLGPAVLLSPVAGVLIDSKNRRSVMMLCDLGMLLVCLPLLYWAHHDLLTVKNVLYMTPLLSVFAMAHSIAYSSSISMLVPEKMYGSANALVQLATNASAVIVPVLAVLILEIAGPAKILLVNIVTYVFAILSLLLVKFPYQVSLNKTKSSIRDLIAQQKFGFQYLFKSGRSVIPYLLVFLCLMNVLNGLVQVLFRPMILISQPAMVIGWLVSIAGVGGLAGAIFSGLLVNRFDKTKVLIAFSYLASLSTVACGLSSNNVLLGIIAFTFSFSIPVVMVASQTLWQLLVPADQQGRVFATRTFFASIVLMLSVLLTPILSEMVLVPLLAEHGSTFAGGLFSDKTGMQLTFVVSGLSIALVTCLASWKINRQTIASSKEPESPHAFNPIE